MQRLLYSAEWDADAACDELQAFVIGVLGDEGGTGVVEETGFLKKGSKSVVFLTTRAAHGYRFAQRMQHALDVDRVQDSALDRSHYASSRRMGLVRQVGPPSALSEIS